MECCRADGGVGCNRGDHSVVTGCERLYTEVFRTASVQDIVGRCEALFSVMPPMGKRA
jgi:hypothetical protein